MTEPIASTSRSGPIARAALPRAANAEPAPTPETDRLKLAGSPSLRSLIEADVRMYAGDSLDVQIQGTVKIQRVFLERLACYALGGTRHLSDVRARFDAASGTYEVSAMGHLWGLNLPLSIRLRPLAEGKTVGFKLEEIGVPFGSGVLRTPFVMQRLADLIASQLEALNLKASPDPGSATVRLDVNSLLHRIGFPYAARFDSAHTRMTSELAANGDLAVHLAADRPGQAMPDTPQSDISLTAGPGAMKEALGTALAPGFDLEQVEFRDGQAVLKGRAEVQAASDIVNTVKVLGALLALGSGANPSNLSIEASHVKIGLEMAVKIEGTHLVITPSLKQAVGSVSEALTKAGLHPISDASSVKVDVKELLAGSGGHFQDLTLAPEGLTMRLHFNLDSLFEDSILKGQR